MRKLLISVLTCLSLLLFLFGCGGDSNPFLGEWRIDFEASRENLKKLYGDNLPDTINLKAEFKENEFLIYLNDSIVNETAITYHKVDDKTWKTCLPNGTQCDEVSFIDKHSMNLPIAEGVIVNMKRI
jgi:hypothetical protein